jgi:phenylalanyl-tRNA synthetase beta chain
MDKEECMMPTINVSEKELRRISGFKGNLEEVLSFFKSELESKNGDEISIDIKDTNRPDLFSVEGLGRAIRVLLTGRTTSYSISGVGVEISRKKVPVRPYIAACVVKGIKLSDQTIKGLMHAQDNLDKTIGRKRKKTSIGLYDFKKVRGPLVYKTTRENENAFVPLNSPEKMTPGEIIRKHPKGMEYGGLLKGEAYPIFIDSRKKVLSFPPIINSNDAGRLTTKTTDVLVEVTGTDEETVGNVLKLVCLILAERGGRIFSGTVGKKRFPEIRRKTTSFSLSKLKGVAGFGIKGLEKCLKRMDYNVVKKTGNTFLVEIPTYRTDIMSEIDIIEDIIIAYGYDRIEAETPEIMTAGWFDERNERTRTRMVGAEYQEVQTFMLTNPEVGERLGAGKMVLLENPINENYSGIRNSLIPGILQLLSKNTHVEYPQKVFEIGEIVDSKANSSSMLCGASCHSAADFTEGKQVLEAVFGDIQFKSIDREPFIKGRCALVSTRGVPFGYLGEIHPKHLEMLGIFNPVVLFEVELIDKVLQG